MTNTKQRVTEAMAARAINWHVERARESADQDEQEAMVERIDWHTGRAVEPHRVTVEVEPRVTITVSLPERGAA